MTTEPCIVHSCRLVRERLEKAEAELARVREEWQECHDERMKLRFRLAALEEKA